jgi:hypothetical protein
MAGRCRSGLAWACALVLLIQALAASMVAGRAAAAQADPLAGIPICAGWHAAGDAGDGSRDHRHSHDLSCDCCASGCCPAAFAAILPQQRQIPVPAIVGDVAAATDRSALAPRQRVAGRFRARAPPLPL